MPLLTLYRTFGITIATLTAPVKSGLPIAMRDTSAIPASLFKQAMRRLAATPSIITTAYRGARYGMTATAVNSVSAEPPSLLVCVNRTASISRPLNETRLFCVNILDANQQDLCRVFSGGESGEARFRSGSWESGREAIPYLKEAQANLLCRVEQQSSFSTHDIFIARIIETMVRENGSPLVYLLGEFFERVQPSAIRPMAGGLPSHGPP